MRLGITAAGVVVVCALLGCGSAHSSDAAFRSQANRICAGMNSDTALPDVRHLDKSLSKIRGGLSKLAALTPAVGEKRAYTDMLTQMHRIYSFSRAHESAMLLLQRQYRALDKLLAKQRTLTKKWQRANMRALKRYARVFKPMTRQLDKASTDALALHLTGCVTTRFTANLHAIRSP